MTETTATRLRVFIPFACGYFLSYLYRVVNAVLAPNLATDIGVDPSDLGLLTAAYFITFAACQLPLGVLLDRFGPRKIEAVLLLFAALGAWIFSSAQSLGGLLTGRALIGLGVSACLMAAFKAFVIWFPKEKLPMINGFQMAAGGMGALTATAPVEAALTVTDWRGVFGVLALLTLAVALAVFKIVPERNSYGVSTGLKEQMGGIGRVFSSLFFWRLAPWTTLSQATLLSIQGLWVGPWLRDVAGFERQEIAACLLLVAAAMVAGFVFLGTAAERLSRTGIRTTAVAGCSMGVFMAVLLLIVLEWSAAAWPLWILFGFFGTSGILPYAVLSQHFPAGLSGRATTAVNLLVFVAAFCAQWGIGAIIELWPVSPEGRYAPAGYQAAFALMLILQAAAFLWFLVAGRMVSRDGSQ